MMEQSVTYANLDNTIELKRKKKKKKSLRRECLLPLSPLILSLLPLQTLNKPWYRHLANEFARTFGSPFHRIQSSMILKFILGLFWYLLHIVVSLVHIWSYVIQQLRCYIISSGLFAKYRNFSLSRLRYLAVVVDSQEAKHTAKIKQLLSWLSAIGVKHVALYDAEGVLKKSIDFGQTRLRDRSAGTCLDGDVNCVTSRNYEEMSIELLSFTDGKEGIAKAASFLCSDHLKNDSDGCGRTETLFTEANMTKALKAVGYYGPEPDLLLVYGLARCHLGFPPWRLRYTEIMHMGPLKSMKYIFTNKRMC
ncbi:dehydrodolichyl diphosphate synthase complex subunit nus1-like isoform X3 [Ananas comosus]|uniref:ditrans,polycis-polyprenyl diphosphate synthase [(2E,6E)-farnesyldiphosphate specific] n=1 Tax=Ananas comosus TaxID=4615 RepID=A0A6P5EFL0_ANACO|nr:dehydrodolichyl diphosphate synthase complex subunit nus1-like isoform X3 [Ananas comosus]